MKSKFTSTLPEYAPWLKRSVAQRPAKAKVMSFSKKKKEKPRDGFYYVVLHLKKNIKGVLSRQVNM